MAVGQSDAAWQPRVNSSSFDVLATAIKAGAGSVPLRRLYGVHEMVLAPQNLLANPNFDARMQKKDGYAAMSTPRPWTVRHDAPDVLSAGNASHLGIPGWCSF